ncbi:MAG: 2,3-epoxybenzoyl-CoA dihydrolase [Myxococcaceae bacterium]
MAQQNGVEPAVSFQTEPAKYRHWKLSFDGEVATLSMNVQEDGGLRPGYSLKLNSYDLGVDIELADAVERLRFEHPEVRAVVVTSAKDRVFCAGANIFMLGGSSHPFKVNFCKYTNETRLNLEDASAHSGLKFVGALNGTASGGGYELALSCDEILLVDDGSSAVSLPEVPLLGVLPGTGGLTRVVDKRKVRRDLADFFSTVAEGVKGKRAAEWRLVDQAVPKSRFPQAVAERARALAAKSDRPRGAKGIALPAVGDAHRYVSVKPGPIARCAELTVKAPSEAPPADGNALAALGAGAWAIQAFRELDDALLRLRMNHLEVGVLVLRTGGDPAAVLAWDRMLEDNASHWLVRETLQLQKRVLRRLDLMSKTLVALVEPASCFSGVLAELALASDRSYMLDDPARPARIELGPSSGGAMPMWNGLTRLQARLLGEPGRVPELLGHRGPFGPAEAQAAGLVTFTPDSIDWDDEVRLALEERASLSPDALTGMEANLRFAGPETMATKIFGRLSAWQNWIFTRPSATGERGALTLYGQAGQRPAFDLRRT